MIILQRIEYIQKNKKRGDISVIADHLSLNYSTVRDIINGTFEGKHAEKVLKKAEKLISNRTKRQERLSKKYSSLLKS